jgi:hypothetical protein
VRIRAACDGASRLQGAYSRCSNTLPVLASAVLFLCFGAGSAGQVYLDNLPIGHAAIQYWQTRPDDAVSRLSAQLDQGTIASTSELTVRAIWRAYCATSE